jgi:hypothetical protein
MVNLPRPQVIGASISRTLDEQVARRTSREHLVKQPIKIRRREERYIKETGNRHDDCVRNDLELLLDIVSMVLDDMVYIATVKFVYSIVESSGQRS